MATWCKARKRPVVIDYAVWDKDGPLPVVSPHACGIESGFKVCGYCGKEYRDHGDIVTLEGVHVVCPGDVVIKGVHGEYYPCKPDIFDETYEDVEVIAAKRNGGTDE